MSIKDFDEGVRERSRDVSANDNNNKGDGTENLISVKLQKSEDVYYDSKVDFEEEEE
jgi:hypothetical protein